jgi:large conductance mechanosensitive channel
MILKEFLDFIKEYNIVALASAVVMGTASTALVNSLVKDIFMPMVAPLLSSDAWREAVLQIGPIALNYGAFLAEVINFTVVSLVVFLVVKKLIREKKKDGVKLP